MQNNWPCRTTTTATRLLLFREWNIRKPNCQVQTYNLTQASHFFSCCRIHMNLIGINQTIPVGPPSPSDEQLRQIINQTHALGGIVIVNHIPWSNTTGKNRLFLACTLHLTVMDCRVWVRTTSSSKPPFRCRFDILGSRWL